MEKTVGFLDERRRGTDGMLAIGPHSKVHRNRYNRHEYQTLEDDEHDITSRKVVVSRSTYHGTIEAPKIEIQRKLG
jgi:hypothetical protein